MLMSWDEGLTKKINEIIYRADLDVLMQNLGSAAESKTPHINQ